MDQESIAKLAQIVRDYMGKRDISVREFAKLADVSSSHVQNIRSGELSDIKVSTLTKIAQAMGMSLADLMVKIGLADKPREFVSASGLSKNALDTYKDTLDKHGDILIRITEKIAYSDINPKQIEKIVDIIAEIKHGNR